MIVGKTGAKRDRPSSECENKTVPATETAERSTQTRVSHGAPMPRPGRPERGKRPNLPTGNHTETATKARSPTSKPAPRDFDRMPPFGTELHAASHERAIHPLTLQSNASHHLAKESGEHNCLFTKCEVKFCLQRCVYAAFLTGMGRSSGRGHFVWEEVQ